MMRRVVVGFARLPFRWVGGLALGFGCGIAASHGRNPFAYAPYFVCVGFDNLSETFKFLVAQRLVVHSSLSKASERLFLESKLTNTYFLHRLCGDLVDGLTERRASARERGGTNRNVMIFFSSTTNAGLNKAIDRIHHLVFSLDPHASSFFSSVSDDCELSLYFPDIPAGEKNDLISKIYVPVAHGLAAITKCENFARRVRAGGLEDSSLLKFMQLLLLSTHYLGEREDFRSRREEILETRRREEQARAEEEEEMRKREHLAQLKTKAFSPPTPASSADTSQPSASPSVGEKEEETAHSPPTPVTNVGAVSASFPSAMSLPSTVSSASSFSSSALTSSQFLLPPLSPRLVSAEAHAAHEKGEEAKGGNLQEQSKEATDVPGKKKNGGLLSFLSLSTSPSSQDKEEKETGAGEGEGGEKNKLNDPTKDENVAGREGGSPFSPSSSLATTNPTPPSGSVFSFLSLSRPAKSPPSTLPTAQPTGTSAEKETTPPGGSSSSSSSSSSGDPGSSPTEESPDLSLSLPSERRLSRFLQSFESFPTAENVGLYRWVCLPRDSAVSALYVAWKGCNNTSVIQAMQQLLWETRTEKQALARVQSVSAQRAAAMERAKNRGGGALNGGMGGPEGDKEGVDPVWASQSESGFRRAVNSLRDAFSVPSLSLEKGTGGESGDAGSGSSSSSSTTGLASSLSPSVSSLSLSLQGGGGGAGRKLTELESQEVYLIPRLAQQTENFLLKIYAEKPRHERKLISQVSYVLKPTKSLLDRAKGVSRGPSEASLLVEQVRDWASMVTKMAVMGAFVVLVMQEDSLDLLHRHLPEAIPLLRAASDSVQTWVVSSVGYLVRHFAPNAKLTSAAQQQERQAHNWHQAATSRRTFSGSSGEVPQVRPPFNLDGRFMQAGGGGGIGPPGGPFPLSESPNPYASLVAQMGGGGGSGSGEMGGVGVGSGGSAGVAGPGPGPGQHASPSLNVQSHHTSSAGMSSSHVFPVGTGGVGSAGTGVSTFPLGTGWGAAPFSRGLSGMGGPAGGAWDMMGAGASGTSPPWGQPPGGVGSMDPGGVGVGGFFGAGGASSILSGGGMGGGSYAGGQQQPLQRPRSAMAGYPQGGGGGGEGGSHQSSVGGQGVNGSSSVGRDFVDVGHWGPSG